MGYEEGIPKIPTAAVTVEDAAWMRRMVEAGHEVRVKLYMEAETLPDADSANVMAEITGSEKPEEVVVMGGHYDSWDVASLPVGPDAGLTAVLPAWRRGRRSPLLRSSDSGPAGRFVWCCGRMKTTA